jgi:hypothetical protein
MMDVFVTTQDYEEGKVLKYQRPNPTGEDVYLLPGGKIERDEDKIILVQRIFKHNYYRAEGPWDLKTREKYVSRVTQPTNLETKSNEKVSVPELSGNPDQ